MRAIDALAIKSDALRRSVMFFVRRRLLRPLLKPALMRFAFELCGGRDWIRILPACTAFELLNISSYQANSAFDEKLGVLNRDDKDAQFIASMLSREAAFLSTDILLKHFPSHLVAKVHLAISEVNRFVYVAQHYDLHRLTSARYPSYLNEQAYIHEYRLRCLYGSGMFNGLCASVGALLAGACENSINSMKEFGIHFGSALQIVNDLGDLVPPDEALLCERFFQDHGSDFKNGRLTYPIYLLIKELGIQAYNNTRLSLDNDNMHNDIMYTIASALLDTDIINVVRDEINMHAKKAKSCLANHNSSPNKSYLLTMLSGLLSNKYFTAFRKYSNSRNVKTSHNAKISNVNVKESEHCKHK